MVNTNIFSNKVTSVLLCLLTCVLWGSLFPIIKVGYSSFEILSGDIPSIILFAGIRFFISGLVLIMISSIKQKKFDKPQKSDMKHILLGALFTIILHYSLTYIALSLGEGSKSAIIKQIGFLFLGWQQLSEQRFLRPLFCRYCVKSLTNTSVLVAFLPCIDKK